jgi:hypothetical protein
MKASLTKLEVRLDRYIGREDIVRCLDVIDALVATRDRAAIRILKPLLKAEAQIADAAYLGLVSLGNGRPRLAYWKRHRRPAIAQTHVPASQVSPPGEPTLRLVPVQDSSEGVGNVVEVAFGPTPLLSA